MTIFSSASSLALRLALREMRGSLKGFRIFAACLVLGVAAISGVGSLTAAIVEGLAREGRSLLGGDVELVLSQRAANEGEYTYLQASGKLSQVRLLRTMVRDLRTDERRLVEAKAVDSVYPLYGKVVLSPDIDLATAIGYRDGVWGAAAAAELVSHLKAGIGDRIRIGDSVVELRAVIAREPDAAGDGFELAPRLLIHNGALDASGLMTRGSLVRHGYRLALPPQQSPQVWQQKTTSLFPDASWRIRDRTNGAPRVREFALRVGQFLLLVGLTTLIVGGVGVAGAVRNYLDSRVETIATLKALGADSMLIRRIYLFQIIIMAVPCIVIGLMLGAAAPWLVDWVAGNRLPVPPASDLYPLPLLKAAVAGILVSIVFTILPIETARRIPAARLYRLQVSGQKSRLPRRAVAIVTAGIAAIAALPFVDSDEPLFVGGFIAATVAAFALLHLAGRMVESVSRRMPPSINPAVRLGIANLNRPGAPTRATIVALGLGLTLFSTLALVETNLKHQIEKNIPERAPAFYFIDIQRDQIDAFSKTAMSLRGVDEVRAVPYLRGQITALNGKPVDAQSVAPEARWALRGDRGLTFAADLPAGNRVSAGRWWQPDYDGPPAISFDSELAQGMGLAVGDTMTVSALGRAITARIMSLREIDWGTLGINFAIVFDPQTLAGAPYTYMATLTAEPAAEAEAFRMLTDNFPSVSAVRMKEVLDEVRRLVGAMGEAVRAASLVTILAGILVLAGATAAGQRDHIYDAVILKLVGGTRATVLLSLLVEYLTLGLAAGIIAAGLGTLSAWLVVTQVMTISWVFAPVTLIVTLAASLVLTVVLGLMGTGAALNARPAAALRALAP